MFKKFDEKDSISGVQQLKSSVQKSIRNKITESFPPIQDFVDKILPKKDPFKIVKCHDHVELIVKSDGEILFFRHREGPWMPSLKLLHKYPFLLPWMQVDKGAIRFILSGANIMCRGLTSPGARMSKVGEKRVVAVMAEGKQHALCVGLTSMSSENILTTNKGIGIENCHYLNDGLWQMKAIK
ncbi:UNVERIFIED_CONTAM: hypothetical protein RMT77_004796 [Armadillidium vulgare]|nr:Malignant T-cell-amplified sequence 1-like protein [Armadillidium vulgare]